MDARDWLTPLPADWAAQVPLGHAAPPRI